MRPAAVRSVLPSDRASFRRTPHTARALSVALILSTLLAACSEEAQTEARRRGPGGPVPVVAHVVSDEAERVRIEAVGTARATRSVELFAEAAGEVVAVNFEPGARVRAGDALVELDARDERLALELADVRLAEARRLLERYEASQARGELSVAETVLDAARSAVDAARIERDRARVALADRTVTAPFDGVVGLTEVDAGDRVDPATLITSLDDRSELLVRFPVPEAYVGRVSAGDAVEIETWTVGRARARGRVEEVDSRIDPTSRSFFVRARVPNTEDDLRPGMSFRVALDLLGDSYPVVPEVAVLWGADGAYVWVVEDERARRVPVAVVQRAPGRVLVEGQFASDARVVAEGVQRMRAGLTVRVLDETLLATDVRRALAPPEAGENAERAAR